ncbi:hypothetical protein [Delftia tsuruhatensis]|uniref:hypothetical protein n=1 Tax=Delftia tsuruhatensis TaxID=180282 RepID=UPI0008E8ED1F|nr:hypothetical protein [Delftia tsuruhatensis]SFB29209.1 hypothetical protein SAMN05444579_103591 [Delftia tsuruhatensis]
MKQKAVTVRFNEYVYGKIESHKINKKLGSFNEALNDLFLELIKQVNEQEKIKEQSEKNSENIEIISTNIKNIASFLKVMNEKK